MLRAKQLSNLSSTARSFFINGTRCGAADGSSCTCCEDESCVSRNQQVRNGVPRAFLSKPSARVENSSSADTLKSLNSKSLGSHNVRIQNPTCFPQVLSTPNSLGISDYAGHASGTDTIENDATSHMSDQLVKAGITAVNLISDLVNYRLPLTDASGVKLPQNCVVDGARPCSNTKSNVKTIRKGNFTKVYSKSSAEVAVGSSATRYSNNTKDKGNKSNFDRGFKRASSSATGDTLKSHVVTSAVYDKKRSIPEKSKAQTNSFLPNFNCNLQNSVTSGENFYEDRKTSRDGRFAVRIAPAARNFPSSGLIVENVSNILRKLRWGYMTEEALEKLGYSMDAYQANQVLKQLQDHNVALGFFYWLKQQPGFWHDDHTYTTMIGILGRAKQFSTINKLLDQMTRDGCLPNVVTYNRIIHSYGRANYLKEAVDVFNQMQKAGCDPDRVTYCTLIDIHAKAGFLDFAMEMYQRMQAAGLSPDTFTYSVIINCLGKAGHLTAANKLFFEMVEQGCVPNLVTYNIMIALQAKARNYQACLDTVGILKKQKHGLMGKTGNVEKAWEWYQTMLRTGLLPNVPTCNSLLSAFLRVHRLGDAYNLLQGMVELGLNPSLQTYTLLLSCCTEARSPCDMGFCCELMAVTGHPAHMFLVSMPSAGPDGQNVKDHVNKFLDLMHSENRESKRGLVDAVVDFFHKSGLKEEAGLVWEVAAGKNVYPDAVKEKSSCYWLINLHVMSDGTAVTALSRTLAWFRRRMLVSGVSPIRIDIVTGWGRRSRVTGSSMVRHAVHDLLHMFSFPFFTENGNSGCFVGCGEPLNKWLLQSYVERMHLL
ncbi:hypothetical protein K2173_027067 [Erythroxylum novogranatense]|uniref:Smr domain-containing protein n=1 Tax=Erythroxylum novogranatense TaxID=1862640 RepID=A0AAV8U0K6_9ROSI|nr:hypothetical protein K2173_027067 [Erythroxylum novogranatense]